MARQLRDLFTPFSSMTPEQQLAHVRAMRKQRYVERPGARRRAEAKQKPKVAKAQRLLEGLSAEDLERLLKEA